MRATTAVMLTVSCLAVLSAPVSAASTPTRCGAQVATIVGTAGPDVIDGTSGADVIAGLGGGDVIRGGDGDDVVCGGDGADRLFGDAGDDVLLGGRAKVYDDRGGSGYVPDRLAGGPGDDTLDIGPEPVDRGIGISGEIRFPNAPAGVVVDLTLGTATGEGNDTVVARPGLRVVGSPFADVLIGSGAPEGLEGRGGPDRIEGRGGDDRLFGEQEGGPQAANEGAPGVDDDLVSGGRGKDLVVGVLGSDDLRGGPGLDVVRADGLGPSRVSGGPGVDFLEVAVSESDGLVLAGGAGRDDLTMSVHPSVTSPRLRLTVDLRTGSVAVGESEVGTIGGVERFTVWDRIALTFHGSEGADVVYAAAHAGLRAWTYGGDDVVRGSRRGDTIDAGEGNDSVRGDMGRDTCLRAEDVRGCEVTS